MLILSGQSLFISAAALCSQLFSPSKTRAWELEQQHLRDRIKGLKISKRLKESISWIQYEVEQSLLILALPSSSWFLLPSLPCEASPRSQTLIFKSSLTTSVNHLGDPLCLLLWHPTGIISMSLNPNEKLKTFRPRNPPRHQIRWLNIEIFISAWMWCDETL